MSWEHAAAVVTVLQSLIESYQGQVGSLPDVQKAMKDAASTEGNQ
jgi:hypothetical protein